MKMIKPTKKEIQFASLMSLVTTFVATFVIVTVNVGYEHLRVFFFIWMRSWLIAFVLVGLSILYVAPLIRKILEK